MDRQTINLYQSRADDYAAMRISKTQARCLSAFLGDLPPGGHILDLGCGPGLHAAEMLRAGFTADAVDAAPAFVEAARGIGVEARVALFEDISGVDVYDGVWASFSLLHAPKTQMPAHLAALKTALKPGGVLCLGMKLGSGEHRDSLGRFYSYYSAEDLDALLSAAGFSLASRETGAELGLAGNVDPYILVTAYG